jgi:hypothetical protein
MGTSTIEISAAPATLPVPREGGAMAIDESRVGVVAASLMEEISRGH